MTAKTAKRRDGGFSLPDLRTLPPDGGPEFNRLVFTSSPYLLQHARNPVDWFPWGEEAFLLARTEDKPIFLSIGYSTCHWCHVMEHESFADREVAEFLNEHFVAIKVDREERPDIDSVYMTFCHATTGGGGWPLSIFLTPDRRPFFAGTYFPREPRFGHPGFLALLSRINDLWHTERGKITSAGADFVRMLDRAPAAASHPLPPETLDRACAEFKGSFDDRHAGFGRAPKFPMAHNLSFLLRRTAANEDDELRGMVERTLRAMAHGGIYDQLGFGFCRYSVDASWLVPHFEKMLYDNALLLSAYVDGWLTSRDPLFARIARETAAYLIRDLQSPEGGFWSAENADSEGVEGKFYAFSRRQIIEILGPSEGPLIADFLGTTEQGNFEHGLNVLHIPVEPATFARSKGLEPDGFARMWETARQALFDARAGRIHPSLDDKILTSWNGLAIAALARVGAALGDPALIEAARRAADFLLSVMSRPDNRLFRSWRAGQSGIDGFLDDYAFFVWGLIELYQSTFETRYLERALAFHETMIGEFLDRPTGLLFLSPRGGDSLFMRPLETFDGALPSGHSAGAFNAIRLARLTGRPELEALASRLLNAMAEQATSHPSGFSLLLTALDFAIGPTTELLLFAPTREEARPWLEAMRGRFMPRLTVHLVIGGQPDPHDAGSGHLQPGTAPGGACRDLPGWHCIPGEAAPNRGLAQCKRPAPELVHIAPFIAHSTRPEKGVSAVFCTGSTCSTPITDLESFTSRLG